MRYSFVIPVYNRPDEVDELLESLTHQTFTDFEVVVVEDGSSIPCQHIVEKYADTLPVHYFDKPNSGPGQTRNYGVERSTGEYVIVLDSDCIIPPNYLQAVEDELTREPADAFGGPDRAHASFTPVQKAINYAMTSFFTTGGIRGAPKRRWTNSTPVVSTWASVAMYTKPWKDSPKCASARTSTSASASSRKATVAASSPKHGCGTNAVPT